MTIDTCKEPCKLLQDVCLIAGKVKELEEQLEQAKEIIEEFMITETCGVGYNELYDKAEQFLKETSRS